MATSALNQLTGMPNLPLASGLMETTKQSPKGYLGGKEVGPILEELKGAEAGAEQRVGEADVAIEQAKRQEKGAEAEKKKLLYERLGTEARELPERKALGEAREKFQEMAFVPTKETAQDLAAMFSLMSVVGMVAGKGNAQLAMSAMNGMLEGHQKGQADLYKKQQVEFDKNFKAMQSKISTLEKQVSEAMELKKYDKEAGEQEINMALAQAESPLLKAMKDKLGDVAVLNAVRGVRKDVDTLVGLQNNLQKAADDRQFAKDEKQRGRELQLEIARIRAAGGGGGALPKDKETKNEHRFRYSAIQNVRDVIDELKKPEVRRLIGPQNQFTPDVLLNLQTGFPELAQKLARFQSEEFKIGGKALTSSEQKILGPIYNWRGLTAQSLEDNLKEAERAMGKEQMYLENMYPGLSQIDYGATPKSQYSLGQIIEKGGKKYEVTDISNPNDPDIREVK
jgi:hypothetical protein